MAIESKKYMKRMPENLVSEAQARRDFLNKAGRYAAVTAPAITLLLGTSLNSRAIAKSGGSRPGHGWEDNNHIHSGPSGQVYKVAHNSSDLSKGHSDSYGGGSHGGSRSGDPN